MRSMPATIGPFHSFAPLDDATRDTTITFFGFHSPVFRARHQGDGQLYAKEKGIARLYCELKIFLKRYALRALKSFRPSAANASLERWRDIRHPAIVSLHQAFWTDQVAVWKF